MIYHFSKLYMAIIIVSVERTLWPLHLVDAKKIENEPISNAISDKDIDDIKKLRIP